MAPRLPGTAVQGVHCTKSPGPLLALGVLGTAGEAGCLPSQRQQEILRKGLLECAQRAVSWVSSCEHPAGSQSPRGDQSLVRKSDKKGDSERKGIQESSGESAGGSRMS